MYYVARPHLLFCLGHAICLFPWQWIPLYLTDVAKQLEDERRQLADWEARLAFTADFREVWDQCLC